MNTVNPNSKPDEHNHRKVITGATIEYLEKLDSDQFKFLMSEIYKVENVKDLISLLSNSSPATILSMLQAAFSCDPRYDIVKYFTYDILDIYGDSIICAATIPEFTGAYSPLQLYYKDSDVVSVPVYLNSVKLILKVNESDSTGNNLELGYNGVLATIADIAGYELPHSWFEYKFDKVVVECDVAAEYESDPEVQ